MREYELEVLEQYDIEVRSTRKIKGCVFLRYRSGRTALKRGSFFGKACAAAVSTLPSTERRGI